MLDRELADPLNVGVEQGIGHDHNCPRTLAHRELEGGLQVGALTHLQPDHVETQTLSRGDRLLDQPRHLGARTEEHGDA